MFSANKDWEILTGNDSWSDFNGIVKSEKNLRELIINDNVVWASDDHPFFVNGVSVLVSQLPTTCTIDDINGDNNITFRKTENVKLQPTYDVVEVDNADHCYIINGQTKTHNCDELAFVKKSIQSDFWGSITPTLSTGGSCIICSTPNGDDDKFAELWRTATMGGTGSDMDFKPIFVAWDQPPNRDDRFKADMISKLGLHVWEQEFECKFISSDAMLMNSNYLAWLTEDLKDRKSISQSIGITQFKNYKPDMTYIIGVDPATGSGKDYSVIEVFEFPSMEQVAEFRSNTMSSPQLYTAFKEIVRGIVSCENTKAYFSIENNGVGEGMISLYMVDEKFPTEVSFISEDGRARLGMTTNQRNKLKNCIKLKQLLENRKFKIRSQSLLKELKNFVAKGGSYEAQTGATDDAICATLIVVRVLDEISQYEDGVTSLLSNDIDVNTIGLNQIGDVIEPNWWGGDTDDVYSANEEPMGVVF